MITLKQINNLQVKPIIIKGINDNEDKRPIKGAKLIPELYANIFLLARKKSGKTVLASKIIKECCTRETTVIVFCSTLDKDPNHKVIKKYCQIQKIPYVGYTSMYEDGVNILQELVNKLEEEARVREEEEENDEHKEKLTRMEKHLMTLFNSDSEDDEDGSHKRKKRNKFQSPEYLIYFDDLSNELKSPALVTLIKKNRHFLCKLLISSQYCMDLLPSSLRQIDFCFIFKGVPPEKIEKLIKDFDLAIPLYKLLNIYQYATLNKFSFLKIDTQKNEYFRNFNCQFAIKEADNNIE
jgi:hypothetical protein